MEQKNLYTLPELLELINTKTIDIPTIQRGFVWGIHQIEKLWDSLLRGYPIGTLVFNEQNNQLLLLDGQQRLTSIYLAFNYSKTNNTNLKTTNDFYKIFIDLEKTTTDDSESRKFVFRVISKSQPWGTQKISHGKKLESKQIDNALKLYNLKDPFEAPLENFYPYDAVEPIPFAFFIQAKSINELEKLIFDWKKEIKFRSTKKSNNKFTLEEIWNYTQQLLKHTVVPAIYLNINNIINESENSKEQENANDEIENLFIRLNSGGTPLTGEELNYSILKSYISVESQKHIEKICFPMFSPARFITIIYRLFQHETKKVNSKDSYSLQIKPKQFQRSVKENQKEFTIYLNKIITEERVEKLEKLLCYTPQNPIGLPAFIAYKLASRAPEVMFILLYRLWIMKDNFDNDDYYKRMLAIITTFSWFGKNGNKNEHTKLLSNIKDFIKEPKENFWSKKLISRAAGKNEGLLIPVSARGIKIPNKLYDYSTFEYFTSFQENENNFEFLSKMFNEKELILYAQREYLFIAFSKYKQELLYNDFTPYDWDHIFPSNWIDNKKKIFYPTRTWYNTIGNFRAWSLSLNRHYQADAPHVKLTIEKKEFEDDILKYLSKQYQNIKYKKHILYEWSICGSEWFDVVYDNIKDKENAKLTLKLIMNRGIEIYKNWYYTLYSSLK